MMNKLLGILSILPGLLAGGAADAQPLQRPPEMAARAYLLLDLSSDQQLAAREADATVQPASLTKLMTAYVVFDALRLGKLELKQTLPVSEHAQSQRGSRMFLVAGMRVPVEDLIKGLLVQSGNDAAIALAEGMAGSEERFVALMNEQAEALGMKATRFVNPTGLTRPGHESTARDLAVLATRLLRDFPDYAHFHAIQKYRYDGTPAANDSNRNLLLFRDPSVDGLKTGHTEAAGYGMIATAQRTFPNLGPQGAAGTRRLLAVVLGADSEHARAAETQKLLNWGYTAFEAVKLFDANQAVLAPAVWKGQAAQARLGRLRPLVVTVPAGMAGDLRVQAVRPDPLVAPLAKGQVVGTIRIFVGEQTLTSVPLLALESVDQAGLIGQAWDAFRLWMQ
jgi:D-alanyl-D-alanine carboxypeptidase (penicillin-binding protein 5/6)